eukprot:Clim_evm12s141 gene=Clim_evmTU12s141
MASTSSTKKPLELHTWSEKWGLTTSSPEGLALMAYAHVVGVNLKIVNENNPRMSPTGQLPFLKDHHGRTITGLDNSLNYLREHGTRKHEDGLSQEEQLTSQGLIALVEESLVPALFYDWCYDGDNWEKGMRHAFEEMLPFPLNYLEPSRILASLNAMIGLRHGVRGSNVRNGDDLYTSANRALDVLQQTIVSSGKPLSGSKYGAVDAVVWACLKVGLAVPTEKSAFKKMIEARPELVVWVKATDKQVGDAAGQSGEYGTDGKSKDQSKTAPGMPSEEENRKMIQGGRLPFIAFTVTAMIGYALYNGMFLLRRLQAVQAQQARRAGMSQQPAKVDYRKFMEH